MSHRTGRRRWSGRKAALITLFLLAAPTAAPASDGYRKPPKAVTDILDAPPPPAVEVSPTRDRLLLLQPVAHPPIADLAAPMLRLAGHRIDPRTNGPARPLRIVGMSLLDVAGGDPRPIALPAGARPGMVEWSPDGKHLAFTNTTADGVELWVADAATARAHRSPDVRLNA